jgi:hypothetical protein
MAAWAFSNLFFPQTPSIPFSTQAFEESHAFSGAGINPWRIQRHW